MFALTSNGMKYMDQYTMAAGVLSPVLMENAARGLAEETANRFPNTDTGILILCGTGNNGGDGVAAGRWLRHMGYDNVQIWFTGEVAKASSECARQLGIVMKAYPDMRIPGVNMAYDAKLIQAEYDVIIDAVYGIGLNRDLSENDSSMIAYINSKKAYRIAADIPSGINGTTGQKMGEALRADLTVTFGNPKLGLYLGEGRAHAGEVVVIDIGILESGYDNVTDKVTVCDDKFFEETVGDALIPRGDTGHKGTYGAVGIPVATSGMLGASILAARAAYRAGCGLVKLLCPEESVGTVNAAIPEAVVVPYNAKNFGEAYDSFRNRLNAVLVGPGLQESGMGEVILKCAMYDDIPAVVDAGALNIIAGHPELLQERNCRCVITPHMGELARLCRTTVEAVSSNRLGYVKFISEKFNVSLVAKSDVSVVALSDRNGIKYCMNVTGNSGLATAGSGDVLAGVIASLIAQGNTMNNSLLYGVMIHGRAADRYASDEAEKRRMMAGDIVDNLFAGVYNQPVV